MRPYLTPPALLGMGALICCSVRDQNAQKNARRAA
jgi:hypothetical protein